MEVTAVVNIRKGSRRIPQKNYQLIGSLPLYLRKLVQLKLCNFVDRVVLTSDDITIKQSVLDFGVEFYLIPDEYADEQTHTVNEVVQKVLSNFGTDAVMWAHCTNPLINKFYYDQAIALFKSMKDYYDSLYSVNELSGHFWMKNRYSISNSAINFNPADKIHKPAKDLEMVYEQNGGIFIRKYSDMREDGKFLGKLPNMYVIPKYDGWDINELKDLEIARVLAND